MPPHRRDDAPGSTPKRVFVLSTGRCGSMSFSEALEPVTNWTAGHETLTRRYGEARFDYPERHIESDNRLSWMLGDLDRRFDAEETLYVHLTRDAEQVARSYLRRWDIPTGIVSTFAHSIIQHHRPWPEEERLAIARFYVSTVTTNIEEFLRGKPHVESVALETVDVDFPRFLDRIDAEGDRDLSMQSWRTPRNTSEESPQTASSTSA